MKIILVSKCSLDVEQHIEFKMSVLISNVYIYIVEDPGYVKGGARSKGGPGSWYNPKIAQK